MSLLADKQQKYLDLKKKLEILKTSAKRHKILKNKNKTNLTSFCNKNTITKESLKKIILHLKSSKQFSEDTINEFLDVMKENDINNFENLFLIYDSNLLNNFAVDSVILDLIKNIFEKENEYTKNGLFNYLSNCVKEIPKIDILEKGIISIEHYTHIAFKGSPRFPNCFDKIKTVDSECPQIVFSLNLHEMRVKELKFIENLTKNKSAEKYKKEKIPMIYNNYDDNKQKDNKLNSLNSIDEDNNIEEWLMNENRLLKQKQYKEKEPNELECFINRLELGEDIPTETALEGSKDCKNWFVLCADMAGASSNGNLEERTAVNSQTFFRYFRITKRNRLKPILDNINIEKFDLFGDIRPIRDTEFKILSYNYDFDENGVVYYFGTFGNTSKWQNPASLGIVKVDSSGMSTHSNVCNFLGRTPSRCVTSVKENAWFSVDFGQMVSIMPSHYTLRHYSSFDTEAVRFWVFQGTNDCEVWDDITIHNNDESLFRKGQSHTWEVPHNKKFYRGFRIKLTGLNSNGHLMLAASGFEVYGTMILKKNYFKKMEHKEFKKENKISFNGGGLMNHLGTLRNGGVWKNPVERKMVDVKVSSLGEESLPFSQVCGQKTVRCVTKAEKGAWFVIGFRVCEIKLSAYSLRHYSLFNSDALRNWKLEGSNDLIRWKTIKHHKNDTSLFGPGSTHTWKCNSNKFYRFFRIKMTGPNSSGNLFLACSGIEFYGTVIFDETSDGYRFIKSQKDKRHQISRIKAFHYVDKTAIEWESDTDMWDVKRSSKHIALDEEHRTALKKSCEDVWETATLKRVYDLDDENIQKMYADIKILAEGETTNKWRMVVGMVPEDFDCNKNFCIGVNGGWGYVSGTGGKINGGCEEFYGLVYEKDDVIRMILDFEKKSLRFHNSGVDQGVAFENISGKVRIAICFTGLFASVVVKEIVLI